MMIQKNILFKSWELLVYVLDWPNLTQPMANQKKEKVSPPERVASFSLFLLFPCLPFFIFLTHFCESVNMKTSTARHAAIHLPSQHVMKGEGCRGKAVEI